MASPGEKPRGGADLRRDGAAALDWAASYLERVHELPVLAQVAPGEIRRALPGRAPDEPEPFEAVLEDLERVLLPGVTHWQHPRYFAYFGVSASAPGILAELLAATLNSVAILWRTAPASTELEGVVLDWVADLLGLPAGWHGHIEDTASTSTLAALIAAREATGRARVVCSEQAHSSVEKAAGCSAWSSARCRSTRSSGCRPMRSAGWTMPRAWLPRSVRPRRHPSTRCLRSPTPAPPPEPGCTSTPRAGSAMVCPEHRWAFAGVERADSLVVNAHKWMLTPVDCSLLWCSRPDALRNAFSLVPEYLRTPDAEDALSLSEYGPALGRRFRSLKLWAVLRCYGRSGLQQHVRRGIRQAELFESLVAADPEWELCAPRPFSIVCFRLRGEDARNRELLERVNASGELFISHAVLAGRYVLRLAAGQQSTTDADIHRAWEALRREAART